MRSSQIEDATGLLVDEQDIPPMALAHQALEMAATESPSMRLFGVYCGQMKV